MAAVGDKAFGMIKGRLSEAVPEALKAYKQGFTESEWKNLDVSGKPLYFDHRYDIGKIGHITNKWVEGGWLGVDAVVYKEEPKVKPYYEEIMKGKAHSLSAGFFSDPVTENQPIKFKRFVEASVTDHPLEPGARIFVRRNDNAGADSSAPTHVVTMPFTVMQEGEALPPPPKHDPPHTTTTTPTSEASKPSGHDQKTTAEQKSGATSTESPKPAQQQALAVTAQTEAQKSAQPSVATSTTSPCSASQLLSNTPLPPQATMSSSSGDASAGQQGQQQQQQNPAQGAPQQHGNGQAGQQQQQQQSTPKSTTSFSNNFSNQESSKKSSDEEAATKEQMKVFVDLQKLLKEKSAKAEQKAKAEADAKAKAEADAAAKAKQSTEQQQQQQQPKEEQQKPAQEEKKKDESKQPAQQLKKPQQQQQQPKKEQQAQNDVEMAEKDDEEEEGEEAAPSDRMSRKDMEKMLRQMQKKVESFEKKEQEAEAARQAEIEATYEQNFSTIMEADKDLKFMPQEIREKAVTQMRAIFHTPEYSEAQQVIANLVARAAEAPQEKPSTEEEQQKSGGKKRVRTEDKPAEKKAKGQPKKAPVAADDDEEIEDVSDAAGFKIPSDMTPEVLRRKMQTGTGKPSSMVKVHSQSFNRGAPPVLVQRNDSRKTSTSTVFSQYGDKNAERAFEYLTAATSRFDPAAKKALDDKWAKQKKLREEGVL